MDNANSRPSHRLFPKLGFRKKQVRHARSDDALEDTLRSINKSKGSPQLPIAEQDGSETAWSIPYIDEGDDESLNLPNTPDVKPLPPYTPIPVPGRVSSAPHRGTNANEHHAQQQSGEQQPRKPSTLAETHDSVSLGSSRFDDNLLRPRSPVSPMAKGARPPPLAQSNMAAVNESPVLPRASVDHRQYQPPNTLPPTPANSTGKRSSHELFPAPPQARIASPPASVSSSNLNVPSKIGPHLLAQLQTPSPDKSDVLETELNTNDDPDSWDVIKPNMRSEGQWDAELYSLEKRAEQLYSAEHLHILLEDADFHSKFSTFLRKYRPWRLPILAYYWDACKALRALNYANSLTQSLSKRTYSGCAPPPMNVANGQLQHAAQEAFRQLLGDDLHWYIAHTYIGIVGAVMQSRITGTLPAPLREASQGLAEVFCITDPTRRDNPIILASQAFTRHSGCNMDYILGRNCRFMQGPGTTNDSCRRFAISMKEGQDHSEIFVNYRRDGSPFLSLVMNAALIDSRGNLRYYLGAQVDVSGLLKNCSGLESLSRLVERQRTASNQEGPPTPDSTEPIKSLSEMLTGNELDIIARNGGTLQKNGEHDLQAQNSAVKSIGPGRVLIADGDSDRSSVEEELKQTAQAQENIPAELPLQELNLRGVYKYYLLVRPAPSLRVLFASPTLRTPGCLQSQFLHRIGGTKMRNDLNNAFQEAKVVTARVRWLKTLSEDGEGTEGSIRWIHCTPLMHHTGAVGLWMIVVVMPTKSHDGPASEASGSSRGPSRLDSRSDEGGSGRGRPRVSQRHHSHRP